MKDYKTNYLNNCKPSRKAKTGVAAGLAIVVSFILIFGAATYGVVIYGV